MYEVHKIRVEISRPAADAYAFLAEPENFPKWASGLARSLCRQGDDWVAETPEGRAVVRFTERNTFGALDHSVTSPRGTTVYVPLRVVPGQNGCELVLTLFRPPDMPDERFAADAEWVMRDLNVAKRILEA